MKGRVKMDKAGRVVFPLKIRQQLAMDDGGELEYEFSGGKVAFAPVEEDKKYRLVNKNGILVIVPDDPQPFDAVAAIKADRQARMDKLERRHEP
ncbi:hypothetical protein [Luteolibacter sp. Populi]|uniref:hypothetical protein n=1 Tax=Luteolibacter sp. Populi TaxID=3230487 RepID=UPI003466D082